LSPGAAIRGARSELRRQLREQKRLRMATLIVASLLLLGALPLYFGIRAATRDPVFNTLDALGVPGWAAVKTVDEVSGSRWCIIECRFRERQVDSEGTPDETAAVYEQSLVSSGWQRWNVGLCPDQPVPEGEHYTCWKRDEYTLDLWVRQPSCADDPLRNRPTVAPTAPAGGKAPPAADPCDGSVVSIKVRNAIDDDRGRPQPTQDPDLTGEDPDPDPFPTDGPLLDETLYPS
jgi:integrin beta 3